MAVWTFLDKECPDNVPRTHPQATRPLKRDRYLKINYLNSDGVAPSRDLLSFSRGKGTRQGATDQKKISWLVRDFDISRAVPWVGGEIQRTAGRRSPEVWGAARTAFAPYCATLWSTNDPFSTLILFPVFGVEKIAFAYINMLIYIDAVFQHFMGVEHGSFWVRTSLHG